MSKLNLNPIDPTASTPDHIVFDLPEQDLTIILDRRGRTTTATVFHFMDDFALDSDPITTVSVEASE